MEPNDRKACDVFFASLLAEYLARYFQTTMWVSMIHLLRKPHFYFKYRSNQASVRSSASTRCFGSRSP